MNDIGIKIKKYSMSIRNTSRMIVIITLGNFILLSGSYQYPEFRVFAQAQIPGPAEIPNPPPLPGPTPIPTAPPIPESPSFKPVSLPEKCSGKCNIGNNSISQNGTDSIAEYEGYAGKDKGKEDYGFYDDIAGHCTVGYGHKVDDRSCGEIDKIPANDPIKKAKDSLASITNKTAAQNQLKDDLQDYVDAVNKNVKKCLYQNEFDSLVSFTYNAGIGALKDSTLLKDINSGKIDKVRDDLSLWNKTTDPKTGGKVVSQGLVNRRTSEADKFEGCR